MASAYQGDQFSEFANLRLSFAFICESQFS